MQTDLKYTLSVGAYAFPRSSPFHHVDDSEASLVTDSTSNHTEDESPDDANELRCAVTSQTYCVSLSTVLLAPTWV